VAESTAACLALQRAIEKANSLDAKKVRDALAALDVTTFYGRIKFDSRGINTFKPMVVEQIQGGEHHTVFPSDVADKQPMYPTPTRFSPSATWSRGASSTGSSARRCSSRFS